MPKQQQVAVGQVIPVPIKMTNDVVIKVDCVILETRKVFGRIEWLVAPVQGDGQTWVRDESITTGKGAHSHGAGGA